MDIRSQNKLNNKVGIVILNWNNFEDTKECLDSILNQSHRNFEVVVIDGGSTNNSTKIIQEKYPHFHYIYSERDSGYSGGNNIGISYFMQKKVEFILSMNNDVMLDKRCLQELLSEIQSNTQAGIVGPRMYSHNNKSIFQISGGFVNIFRSKPTPKWVKEDKKSPKKPFTVIKLPGACLLVRNKAIKEVGLMDEGFFLYYADTDWEKRFSDKGWLQISVPKAKAYHKVSATIGQNSKKLIYYDSRDFLFYVKKHHGFFTLVYCLVKSWISKNYKLFVTQDQDKLSKLKLLSLAYLHFFLGIRGKYK